MTRIRIRSRLVVVRIIQPAVVVLLGILLNPPIVVAFISVPYHVVAIRSSKTIINPSAASITTILSNKSYNANNSNNNHWRRCPSWIPQHHTFRRQHSMRLQQQHNDNEETTLSDSTSGTTVEERNNEDGTTTLPSSDNNDSVSYKTMRVSEIRTILHEMNINYSDCFDKESLLTRLLDAKNGTIQPKSKSNNTNDTPADTQQTNVKSSSSSTTSASTSSTSSSSSSSSSTSTFDEVSALQEARSLRVKQLKEELSKYHVRWGNLFEKDDLVRALVDAQRKAYQFSVTGTLVPGTVTDVTDEIFTKERAQGTTITTPILLDVYATWCGPCKIMASELQQVAVELYDTVRVMKLDSDKYPQLSSTLRVQGLPTLILLDASGQEINRMEGAIPKQQLLQWIQDKIPPK